MCYTRDMAGADDMVEQAFDPKQQDVVARAIEQLSPEEAQFFLGKLERAIRKRKLQLTGYLIAMVVWLIAMVVALYVYGTAPEGTFVGWVFIMPFGLVGLVLYIVGKYAERVARGGGSATPEIRAKLVKAQAGAMAPDAVVSTAPASAKSAKPE